jgi:hypothetical protein
VGRGLGTEREEPKGSTQMSIQYRQIGPKCGQGAGRCAEVKKRFEKESRKDWEGRKVT